MDEVQDAWILDKVQNRVSVGVQKRTTSIFFRGYSGSSLSKEEAKFIDIRTGIVDSTGNSASFKTRMGQRHVFPFVLGHESLRSLQALNPFMKVPLFRMKSLQTIISVVKKGNWMASVNLQDAYLHVPIDAAHQRFLRFAIEGLHFQFRCLPFGLCTAPRTFSKVLSVVIAVLRVKRHTDIPLSGQRSSANSVEASPSRICVG